MAELVVGIDLGTTGTRGVLYRADGTVVADGACETPLRWSGPGHVDQDPEDFVAAALDAINQCLVRSGAAAGDVAAVGVSGQMAGVLGVGADGAPSTPYDSWLDQRCAAELAELDREHGEELVRVGGCPPMVNHAPKLRWWRNHRPEVFDRTAKWLMPGGYVTGRIGGLPVDDAYIDATYLHFTGLADVERGTWSTQLGAALGVPEWQLPRIVEPATVVGALTEQAAGACGLLAGTPLAAGLGDTAASALGAGVVRPGQLLDVAGTAAVLAASTDRYVPDATSRTLLAMRGAVPGQWIRLAFLSGGSLLPWLAELFGVGGDEEAAMRSLADDAASVAAGADGLLFVPHLDGRLLPSAPSMRGAWLGLHRRHGRAHLARAVLESVAYEYAGYLGVVGGLDEKFVPADGRVVGGGARSATWNAIKASVLEVPLSALDREELACWGAALVGAAAVGLVDDLPGAADQATAVTRWYEPDPADHATYEQYEAVYRDAVAATGDVTSRLAELTRR